MSIPWAAVGAAVGSVLGVANAAWALWARLRDRPALKLSIVWEYSEPYDPDDSPSPYVTIVNTGGRTAYLASLEIVEKNGRRHTIGSFADEAVGPDQQFTYRPDWSEPSDDEPRFFGDWPGIRIVAVDARGRRWRSAPPKEKPRWYFQHSPDPWWETDQADGSATAATDSARDPSLPTTP